MNKTCRIIQFCASTIILKSTYYIFDKEQPHRRQNRILFTENTPHNRYPRIFCDKVYLFICLGTGFRMSFMYYPTKLHIRNSNDITDRSTSSLSQTDIRTKENGKCPMFQLQQTLVKEHERNHRDSSSIQ